LSHLNLPSGWDQVFTKKGAGIVLGVVDSGIDFDNSPEEFIYPGCAPLGYDMSTAYPEEGAPTSSLAGNDDIGHGTAVAAIAAAANNDVQGVGVAPEVLLVSLKVFSLIGESQEIKGTLDDVSRSLQMAYQLGVHVINMSLGCQGCDATTEEKNLEFYDALLKSLEAGHNPGLIFNSECTLNFEQRNSSPIIVASSGNDGDSQLDAPAVLPGIISVGSVSLTAGDDGNRSRFSNYGPGLDFLAEGENLITTNLGGDFGRAELSGTSFSAPQVAGLVAMILAENPSLSTQDVRELIAICFVHDLGAAGWDIETGYGRIYIADEDALAPNCMPQAWSN
jgi:subtilisin family serine protease